MRLNKCQFFAVGILATALAASSARAQDNAEKLYKAKCAACHADKGSGDTVMGKKLGAHDFRGADVQKLSDADLSKAIAKGKNKMPGYEKTLKADEIQGLVAHIRELAKKK